MAGMLTLEEAVGAIRDYRVKVARWPSLMPQDDFTEAFDAGLDAGLEWVLTLLADVAVNPLEAELGPAMITKTSPETSAAIHQLLADWDWDKAMGKIPYGTKFGDYCEMVVSQA